MEKRPQDDESDKRLGPAKSLPRAGQLGPKCQSKMTRPRLDRRAGREAVEFHFALIRKVGRRSQREIALFRTMSPDNHIAVVPGQRMEG